VVNLAEQGNEAFTVADVIDRINNAAAASGAGITASLNVAGTGLKLTDTSGGSGTLAVDDLGSGSAASQLGLTRSAVTSGTTQIINGSAIFSAAASNSTGIEALAQRINDARLGINAQSLFDGAGHRLVLTSATPGAANELLVRSSIDGVSFSETSAGRDALAQLGGAGGVITSSTTNVFENVVPGVRFTARQVATAPVNVTVTADDQPAVRAAQGLVDAFNSLRTTVSGFTDFDSETLTTGILFGRSEVVRIEADLGRLLSGRISGAGAINSLESLGISLNDQGQLTFDSAKFSEAYAASPNDVEQFFASQNSGVVARIDALVEQLAGSENSLLSSRSRSLTANIEVNTERIDQMTSQLDRQRDRLLLDFYRLEETIAKIQGNLTAVESITAFEPLSIRR
jgi:flagellar hook-associated protein 2